MLETAILRTEDDPLSEEDEKIVKALVSEQLLAGFWEAEKVQQSGDLVALALVYETKNIHVVFSERKFFLGIKEVDEMIPYVEDVRKALEISASQSVLKQSGAFVSGFWLVIVLKDRHPVIIPVGVQRKNAVNTAQA